MQEVANQLLPFVFLFSLLLPVTPQNLTTSRLVVTFKTRADNLVTAMDALDLTTVGEVRRVKQYGRRLVLDLGRPYNLSEEAAAIKASMPAVDRVEADILVTVADTFTDTITDEAGTVLETLNV